MVALAGGLRHTPLSRGGIFRNPIQTGLQGVALRPGSSDGPLGCRGGVDRCPFGGKFRSAARWSGSGCRRRCSRLPRARHGPVGCGTSGEEPDAGEEREQTSNGAKAHGEPPYVGWEAHSTRLVSSNARSTWAARRARWKLRPAIRSWRESVQECRLGLGRCRSGRSPSRRRDRRLWRRN